MTHTLIALALQAIIAIPSGKLAGRILRPLIDALFGPLERDHCRKSFESEQRRAQLPAVYRESP